MDNRISKDARVRYLLTAALEGSLTENEAEELAGLDRRLGTLAWLAVAKRIAELDSRVVQLNARLGGPPNIDPSTPSGQRPIYTKPVAPKPKARPGAKRGHSGARRPMPAHVDEHKDHHLDRCPSCGGELQRCRRSGTRTIEDILLEYTALFPVPRRGPSR